MKSSKFNDQSSKEEVVSKNAQSQNNEGRGEE
jgi:hypothetical protein